MKTCYFCKGAIEKKKVKHVHQWNEKFYLFENIPAEVCTQCGEVFFPPQSLEYIDQVVQSASKAVKEVRMPVFSVPNSVSA